MKLTILLVPLLVVSALTDPIPTSNVGGERQVKETKVVDGVLYQYNLAFYDNETKTMCPGNYELSLDLKTHRMDMNEIAGSFGNKTACDLTKHSLILMIGNDLGLSAALLKTSNHIPQ